MTADAIKSASVTNLDASPVVPNTAGSGAPGKLQELSDYVLPTAAGLADTGSKYKLIRVSPEIKLKQLKLNISTAIESSTGLAIDVGAYYSDSTVDGTPAALQGTSISVNCFAAALAPYHSSAIGEVDVLSSFSPVNRNKRLWDALGLSSNPGGNIDIVLAVHTAATGAASHEVGVSAKFVP